MVDNYGMMACTDAADFVGMQLRRYDHWLKGEDNGVEWDKSVKLFIHPIMPGRGPFRV